MIKTVIFDLGNVIVSVDETNLYNALAKASSKNINEIIDYFEHSSTRKNFERGKFTAGEFYARVVKELNLKMNFKEFNKYYCNIFNLNDDVAKLIKKLRKNFRLILLSNTDKLHFEYIKNKFKVVNIFDDYVLSYKVGCRKPNPLIFLNALRKAKTLPFNCVFIDDIPEFVYVARLMGIRAFQYKKYEKLVEDLRKVKVLTKGL